MNIEQQLEALQAQLDALREQCKQQPKFKYPIYMQSKENKAVVKFDSLTSVTVVTVGVYKNFYVGYVANDWIPHTDTITWQPITFDEERGIADKQLCECWDEWYNHDRVLKFYDAKNKCFFTYNGKRNGVDYNNYHPIPYADWPDWAIEAQSTLED